MLTESQRKWLTEYIGECWHEWHKQSRDVFNIHYDSRCIYCGVNLEKVEPLHRTFLTWADLGAVMEAIQKKGEWHSFLNYAHEICPKEADFDNPVYGGSDIADFTAWLINPSRLPELVCRWKGVE